MSITTYAELRSAIGDFLLRDDLDSAIPMFISLAEAGFNRDVRHWRMDQRSESVLNDRFLDRPDDWVATVRLSLSNADDYTPSALELVSANAMADKRSPALNRTGIPQFYRHFQDKFEVFPTPDGEYSVELDYVQKIPALSDNDPTNWLLEEFPDAYLYGALIHSAPYLVEDERLATWTALYSAALSRINQSSEMSAWSGTGLRMRNRGAA